MASKSAVFSLEKGAHGKAADGGRESGKVATEVQENFDKRDKKKHR
jgi:hypothetical protein